MKTLTLALVAALALTTGCHKKDASDNTGTAASASKSGLAWEPVGLDKMGPDCKKDLACCEAITKAEKPSATADDYNLKCSGPALWKEADCKGDLASRVEVLGDKQPVPDACK